MDSQKQVGYKLDRIYKFKSREELCNEYGGGEYDVMKYKVPGGWNEGQLYIAKKDGSFRLFNIISGETKEEMIKPFNRDSDGDFISLDFI